MMHDTFHSEDTRFIGFVYLDIPLKGGNGTSTNDLNTLANWLLILNDFVTFPGYGASNMQDFFRCEESMFGQMETLCGRESDSDFCGNRLFSSPFQPSIAVL
jgi:hypothetical protein